MSSPLDLSLFPDLPPEVVKAFGAMQFELSVERAARQHEHTWEHCVGRELLGESEGKMHAVQRRSSRARCYEQHRHRVPHERESACAVCVQHAPCGWKQQRERRTSIGGRRPHPAERIQGVRARARMEAGGRSDDARKGAAPVGAQW